MSAQVTPKQLLLLGIGGAGCRLAHAARRAYGEGMRAVCADTDAMTTRMPHLPGLAPLLLGGSRLSGQGAAGDAIQGRLAAQDDMPALAAHLKGVRTVVVTAGLGAGTGGGAAAEIIKRLHDTGMTTLCFATLPFSFESEDRREAAGRILPMIEENADSLVTVPLDNLFADAGKERLAEAMEAADGIIASGIALLWRCLTSPGFIRLDPDRLHNMILRGGNARFGAAAASGEGRAAKAVETLAASALLESGGALKRARAVLLGILAGGDLRLAEVGEIMEGVKALCGKNGRIEMGTVLDAAFDGRIELVALAFDHWAEPAAPAASPSAAAEPAPDAPAGKRGRKKAASKLTAAGRGKFQGIEATLENGEDLDVPTYQRRGITLER